MDAAANASPPSCNLTLQRHNQSAGRRRGKKMSLIAFKSFVVSTLHYTIRFLLCVLPVVQQLFHLVFLVSLLTLPSSPIFPHSFCFRFLFALSLFLSFLGGASATKPRAASPANALASDSFTARFIFSSKRAMRSSSFSIGWPFVLTPLVPTRNQKRKGTEDSFSRKLNLKKNKKEEKTTCGGKSFWGERTYSDARRKARSWPLPGQHWASPSRESQASAPPLPIPRLSKAVSQVSG